MTESCGSVGEPAGGYQSGFLRGLSCTWLVPHHASVPDCYASGMGNLPASTVEAGAFCQPFGACH